MKVKLSFYIRQLDVRRFFSGAVVLVSSKEFTDSIEITLPSNKFIFIKSNGTVTYVRLTTFKERLSFKWNKRRWIR